ncbi:MAG: hypothetical protein LBV41_09060 [Cytophagaceae bacterium]|jgi:hypothetical protein|nr:hypothetical protein [Cytophagaceae bacterium]
MDEFLHLEDGKNVVFQYNHVSDEKSYIDHILQLSDKLKAISLVPDKELLFTAYDIPFYHFFKYPELVFFRIYSWHNAQKHNIEPFHKFCNSSENNRIIPIYEKMYHDYTHIPSKEIWTKQTVDTTLQLLEYYCDTDAFESRDTILLLTSQLLSLVDSVKQLATSGYKENINKTPISLYSCSVDVENSFMMLRNGSDWTCTLKMYAINRIASENKVLCFDTLEWIESLISKSILISGNTAFKERVHFFDSIKEKIQLFMKKINA